MEYKVNLKDEEVEILKMFFNFSNENFLEKYWENIMQLNWQIDKPNLIDCIKLTDVFEKVLLQLNTQEIEDKR